MTEKCCGNHSDFSYEYTGKGETLNETTTPLLSRQFISPRSGCAGESRLHGKQSHSHVTLIASDKIKIARVHCRLRGIELTKSYSLAQDESLKAQKMYTH